jgi:hypothetical protein
MIRIFREYLCIKYRGTMKYPYGRNKVEYELE